MKNSNNNPMFGGKLSWIASLMIAIAGISVFTAAILGYRFYQKQGIQKQQNITLQQQRNELLKTEGLLLANWLRTLSPRAKKITGDLLWSQEKQAGIMRFSGLPRIDSDQQFHLWIYDRNGELDAPVSGAIFRSSSKELIVPFKATSAVKSPYKFVVKLETSNSEKDAETLLLVQQ